MCPRKRHGGDPIKTKDLLLGLLVVVVWGLNFIAIKLGLKGVPPLIMCTLRFSLAAFPLIFFIKKPPIPDKWLMLVALSLNVGQFGFGFIAMKVGMPAGLASLVWQAQAFFTLILAAAFMKERLKRHNLIGMALAAVGLLVISSVQDQEFKLLGFALAIAASFSWAVGNIFTRKISLTYPPFPMLSLVVWASAYAIVPLFILSLIFEGASAWQTTISSIDSTSVLSILYIAYISTILGYTLWSRLLAGYPAATVAPLSLLVPVVGMSSAFVLLGEKLGMVQLLGAGLILSGLYVNVFGQRITTNT